MNPIPSFDTLRSMLELEERYNHKHTSPTQDLPLVTANKASFSEIQLILTTAPLPNHRGGHHTFFRGGRNSRGRHHGSTSSFGYHWQRHQPRPHPPHFSRPNRQSTPSGPTSFSPSWPYWAGQHWAQPPAPFPTTPWAPSHSQSKASPSAGLLGPRPAQSYHTGTSASMGYMPTDIDQAMNTLSLSTPNEQFYMDTGATSHMTHSQGNLMLYFPLKHEFNNAIVVGNGQMIPIHGYGQLSFPSLQQPLTLKNVLHAPKLI